MTVSIEEAAEAYREAMRAAIKKHSFWYLVEGVLLVAAGVLAVVYPLMSSLTVIASWVGFLFSVALCKASALLEPGTCRISGSNSFPSCLPSLSVRCSCATRPRACCR